MGAPKAEHISWLTSAFSTVPRAEMSRGGACGLRHLDFRLCFYGAKRGRGAPKLARTHAGCAT
eukprot:2916531-Pyramimonas_sp.AAC.1